MHTKLKYQYTRRVFDRCKFNGFVDCWNVCSSDSFFLLFVLLIWFLLNVQIADYLPSISQRCYATVNASTLLPNNHIPLHNHISRLPGFCNPIIAAFFFFIFLNIRVWTRFVFGWIYLKLKKNKCIFFHCNGIVSIKLSLKSGFMVKKLHSHCWLTKPLRKNNFACWVEEKKLWSIRFDCRYLWHNNGFGLSLRKIRLYRMVW